MVNMLHKTLPQQVAASHPEESRNLASSRLRIQCPQLENSSHAIASNTTFDSFRANCGQSGFLQFPHDEIGERLQRQPSVISSLPLPSQAPAELVYLLGDKDGKLKAGATIQLCSQKHPSHVTAGSPTTAHGLTDTITLERAKPRPRVGLDLRLSGNTFVQGQIISGQLVVHVCDAEFPVRLANPKLRVIGFECLADSPTSHVFFHYSSRFDEISYAGEQIFSEGPDYGDEDGYREARGGQHVLPFEMMLPEDSYFGKPKGVLDVPGGVSVRYVIMASVNIKDPDTNQLSLAHFYRECSIWPSLSIHDVLVPSTRPLVSTAAMTLSQGGLRRKLKLSARIPRLSYLSGQRCHVHVQILNDTYKTVRSMRLTVIRTTTVYRPQSGKRNRRDQSDDTTTSYQTKAFVDVIAESRLAMAERTTRKCASSRGWWAGVSPQDRTGFTHSILIPSDALSIARTELLAVDHEIRITVYASTGALGLTSHLSVTLPILVLSMLSVEPQTSLGHPLNVPTVTHANGSDIVNGLALHFGEGGSEHLADSPPPYRTRPSSLEHPQGNTEILPHYNTTPSARSTTTCEGSQMHEYASGETSPVTESPLTNGGHRAASSARSSVHEEGDTTNPDAQAGGGAMPERSRSNDARALSTTYQNSPGKYVVSPTPSLCRARIRALLITDTPRVSSLEQPQTQGGVRNQDVHGDGDLNRDGRRDLSGYESPFSRRVKEKVRRVQAHREDSPGERSKRTAELPSSAKSAERSCKPEIQEPLAHPQEQSVINASSVDRDAGLCRIKPLYARTAKTKSIMGPRKPNVTVAPAPGSVMDRVRMIEG